MKNIFKQVFRMFGAISLVALMLAGSWTPLATATNDQSVCSAPLDVVLVFDRSDSMTYDTADWPTPPIQPLADAQDGTIAFIDVLDSSSDRVGLVDFYAEAELTQSLTSNYSAVKDSVDDVWWEGWTNVGAGVDTAHQELTDNGRNDVKQVIVLLSDGNPTKPQNSSKATEYAFEQINEAKADGVVVYTIGWGDDVNHEFLEDAASDPSFYYYAPNSAGLEDAYMELAESVCEPEDKDITATALLDHSCDASEWHFLINQIDEEANAPQSINVTWANSNTAELTLDSFTGGVAHYYSYDNLDSTVTSATTTIYDGWDGKFNLSHGPDTCEEPTGSINICKIVINEEGEVVDGSENNGSFTIAGVSVSNHPTVGDSAAVLADADFSTALSFNADLLGNDGVDDAQCVSYDNLALGNYYYDEEEVTGDNWETPLYNDGNSGAFSSLGDAYAYSNELFTDDAGVDDPNRNTDADGHIILSENRKNRTLVVVNQYVLPNTPPTIVPYGDDPYVMFEGDNYVEKGADAEDAEDGDLDGDVVIGGDTVTSTSSVGTYTVTYEVTDSDGNTATTSRAVIVKERPAEYATLVAHKIVCEAEEHLPDWGATKTPIDKDTVGEFMDGKSDVCELVAWDFQWAPQGTTNPGDQTDYADLPWTTFSGSTTIDLADVAGDDFVWVRESFDTNYIPFGGANQTAATSAEMYCHTDTINYDNYDRVDGPLVNGETYYCVAFNVPVEVPPQCSIEGYKFNAETGEGIENWTIGLAEIGQCEDGSEWADEVISYDPVGTIADDRDNPQEALGSTDYDESNGSYNFVSLGKGGSIVLGFDNIIVNGPGDDIEVTETSWNSPTCEQFNQTAEVYASKDGNDWTLLGEVCMDGTVDLGGMDWAKYVKIVDKSTQGDDGYDVDAVRALNCGSFDVLETTTTDEFGGYCFADLPDGDYTVFEEMKGEWEIEKVEVGQSSADYYVDSFFDVFTNVSFGGDTLRVDFFNKKEVVVVNEPPVADAGINDEVTLGNPVVLDGTGSYDTDGTIVSYEWALGDGNTASGATTTHTYAATGTYSVVLTVTDDEGATDTDTIEVKVIPRETPPVCENVVVVSNTDDMVVGGSNAVATYDGNIRWTADIEGATWIWETYLVSNPAVDEVKEFTKSFNVEGIAGYAELHVASDNIYTVYVNGSEVQEVTDTNNYQIDTQDVYDVTSHLNTGTNTVSFVVQNNGVDGSDSFGNPAGLMYRLEVEIVGDSCLNTPPEIFGTDEPLIIYVGESGDLDTLARDGVTADDAEDGDVTGDIVITGLDTISTTTISTTTIYYDVEDSGGLDAQQKEREVRVVTECSDGIDNDDDGYVDSEDRGCFTDPEDPETYDPNDNNESDDPQNTKPVITLAYGTLTIDVGDSFNPFGGHASANDAEDGDITDDLTATGTVDTATEGTYQVTYNVVDSEGLAADAKILTVNVDDGPTIVSGGGGGGGGGGYIPQILTITNEDVEYLGNGQAVVTWNTNVAATSRVVYGDESVPVKGDAPNYGYDSSTAKDGTLVTSHSMTVTGLTDGVDYFFRPISDKFYVSEVVGRQVTYGFDPIVSPVQCNYLLEFIQLGADNNPVEVEKLERFLNEFEGENLAVNGVYEQADFEAVERFQNKYFSDILGPWGHNAPTGYVYITTKKKINEIYCERTFPLTGEQELEINAFNALLAGIGSAQAAGEETETPDFGSTVGLGDDDTGTGSDSNLADASDDTDTANEAVGGAGLLANILSIFGLGDDDAESATSTGTTSDDSLLADGAATGTADQVDGERSLAAVIMGGAMSVATSYWFIFLLAVFAVILFFRIRGAENN